MTPTRRRLLRAGSAALLLAAGHARAAETFEVAHADEEWRALLGPDRYLVLRQSATEPPFSSPLLKEHRAGTFACAGCARPLFASSTKFDSDTGWPSFWRARPKAVAESRDRSLGMERTAVHCRGCGGHLGHVFGDGPRPTNLRYCINGLALAFTPKHPL